MVVDLVLSGDNAIVIGMAARRLPPRQRRMAIILGGGGAILLRVLFAAIAAVLLAIPLLGAAGGLLLLGIAWKLLREGEAAHDVSEGVSLFGALRTIIMADVVMSLDNILAIAGVSHGNVGLLLFGLLLSMPLILFGSGLIANAINRLPWLALVGAGVLAWTGGAMLVEDQVVAGWLPHIESLHLAIPGLLTAAVLAPSLRRYLALRSRGVRPQEASAPRQLQTSTRNAPGGR